MLRNTQRTQDFLMAWLQHMRGQWNDQVTLNDMVLRCTPSSCSPTANHFAPFTDNATGVEWNLSWSTWAHDKVSGSRHDCGSNACIAFHAVLHPTGIDATSSKLGQLRAMLAHRRQIGLTNPYPMGAACQCQTTLAHRHQIGLTKPDKSDVPIGRNMSKDCQ